MSVSSLMTALANAVRSKTGATGKLSIEQMTTSLNNANIHDTTSVTATAGDVLSGKKIVSSTGASVTGTMTDNGAVAPSALNCGESYTIPAGHHNGSGKVTAASLESQTEGTAVDADILKDKTAYVNGSKVTGTMTNNGAVSPAALNAGGSYTIPAGYHNGSGKVTTNSLESQTQATATADEILTGKTAWVGGTKLTGTMTKGVTPAHGTGTYKNLTESTIDAGKFVSLVDETPNPGVLYTGIATSSGTKESCAGAAISNTKALVGWFDSYPYLGIESIDGSQGLTNKTMLTRPSSGTTYSHMKILHISGSLYMVIAIQAQRMSMYSVTATESSITVNATTAIESSSYSAYNVQAVKLSNTSVFITYHNSSGLYGRVITVSDTTFTAGTKVTLNTATNPYASNSNYAISAKRPVLVALDSSRVLMIHYNGAVEAGISGVSNDDIPMSIVAQVASISGTSITMGSASNFGALELRAPISEPTAFKASGSVVWVVHGSILNPDLLIDYYSSYKLTISGTSISVGSGTKLGSIYPSGYGGANGFDAESGIGFICKGGTGTTDRPMYKITYDTNSLTLSTTQYGLNYPAFGSNQYGFWWWAQCPDSRVFNDSNWFYPAEGFLNYTSTVGVAGMTSASCSAGNSVEVYASNK